MSQEVLTNVHEEKPPCERAPAEVHIHKSFLDGSPIGDKIGEVCSFLPANTWSLIRVFGPFLIPLIISQLSLWYVLGWILFLALTDFIDGKVAKSKHRKFNRLDPCYVMYLRGRLSYEEMYKSGELFDPSCDKAFFIISLIFLAVIYAQVVSLVWWFIAAVVEVGGRLAIPVICKKLKRPYGTKANFWGKLKLNLEVIFLLLIIAHLFDQTLIPLDLFFYWLLGIIFFSILSGFGYIYYIPPPQAWLRKRKK